MWSTTLWQHSVSPHPWIAVILSASVAAVWDWRTGRIPNAIPAVTALAGLIWSNHVAGYAGLLDGALGCLMLMLPYILLFVFASGGAGDAKLMGSLGVWMGMINGAVILGCVAVAGIVMAVLYAAARKHLGQTLRNISETVKIVLFRIASRNMKAVTLETPSPQMTKMPYGPAILAGVLLGAMGVHLWRA